MEVGGYEHVAVLQNIKVVDGDHVETLRQIPRGTVPVLDAIVVGMDMLIKKYSSTNKGKKRLCLMTNGLSPIKDPYEGSKEDQVNAIAEQMTSHGMKLECVVVRESVVRGENVSVMEENYRILNLFPQKSCAKTIFVESSTSLLGALKTRNISPVTIFRGDLEISPKLNIKEPKQFNDFLHQLCKFCLQNDLRSFCDFLATKGITLISKTEAADSDVTEEEARSFLVRSEPKPE